MKQYLKTIYRMWNIFKPIHKWMILELIIIFLVQVLYVGLSFITSKMMDALVTKEFRIVAILLTFNLAIEATSSLLQYLQNRMNVDKMGPRMTDIIQQFSLRKILGLTIDQHTEDHSAMKLTIISQGEGNVTRVIDSIMIQIIPALVLLIISFATLATINIKIAGIVFVFFIILGLWSYYFSKSQYPYILKNRDNWNEQQKFRTEAFGHLQLVKALGRESRFIKDYINSREKLMPHQIMTSMREVKHFFNRALFSDITSIATLSAAVYFYFGGLYALGTIYLITSMSGRVFGNIRTLVFAIKEIPQSFAHIEKYLNIIDREPNFSEIGKKGVPLDKDIVISNLTFKYPKSENPVLDDCSIIIPNGKVTAFVGHSGSGKSTIARLLLRAYNYNSGVIKIGDIELKEIDAQYLRESIGYVEQHVDLFDDSVKNNILIAVNDEVRKEREKELDDIGERTRISEFYHRLGDAKWDTVVGERGLKLSGGERQRIGIARAIIKDPEILIFDEATASLDSINEKYVMDAIHEVAKGKTTIIVAHRLSTVFNADKIVVMDMGRIIGEGTHLELMKSSQKYQDLVAHQMYEQTKTA
jgi:ABC-type multidrug transport system fused ATPase/permease subunit